MKTILQKQTLKLLKIQNLSSKSTHKVLLMFLLTSMSSTFFAQNYMYTFTGSGAQTTVDQVIVENLTKGTSKTISGSSTLYLNPTALTPVATKLEDIQNSETTKLIVYPNPALDAATLSFNLPETGNVTISVNDLSGKNISMYSDNLEAGSYKFQLPECKTGLYLVSVNGKGYRATEKLLSINPTVGEFNFIKLLDKVSISLLQSVTAAPKKTKEQVQANEGLAYNTGDILKLTGVSGRCKTIIIDNAPRRNNSDWTKHINFTFINCIDGSDNAYAVVKVGQQYWMAENLKTTNLNDGTTALTKINTQTGWNTLTKESDAYCYYGDLISNGTIYGGLYTQHAANTCLAPTNGWRLPTQSELAKMISYIDGKTTAGLKLKEKGTGHWTTNAGATNETGFSALPGGYRSSAGFDGINTKSAYWTAPTSTTDTKSAYGLLDNTDSLSIYKNLLKQSCLSVRYVYDVADSRITAMKNMFGSIGSPVTKVLPPLSQIKIVMSNDKELFFAGRSTATSAIPQLRLLDNPSSATAPLIPSYTTAVTGVQWWENFKKACPQLNENARENTVLAVWNEAQVCSKDPNYQNIWGQKQVTLHIIGDTAQHFANKSILLPESFTMPDASGGTAYNNWPRLTYSCIVDAMQWEMTVKAGDINGDGVQDIFVAVHDMLRVYDGVTYKLIDELSFQSDHNLTPEKAFCLRVEVADIDKNGTNDILVLTSSNMSSNPPKLHVFLNGKLNPTNLADHIVTSLTSTVSTQVIKTASFAVGDITGDDKDEIVFHVTNNDGGQFVTYFNYDATTATKFTALKSLCPVDVNTMWMGGVILAKLKGPLYPNYIVTSNYIVGVDLTTGALGYPFGNTSYIAGGGLNYQVLGDQMVAGNFDKDPSGKDKVYYIHTAFTKNYAMDNTSYLNCMYINDNGTIGQIDSKPYYSNGTNDFLDNYYPVITGVNTKHAGRILNFTHYEYLSTNPVVNAVLAVAPYYPNYYTGTNSPSTSWGQGNSSSNITETSMTHSSSLIVGFEHDFEIPLTGVKVGGINFTATVSSNFSTGFSSEIKKSTSTTYSTNTEDGVIVTTTPYDAYFYKVLKSENSAEVGSEIMLGFPRTPVTTNLTLDSYNEAVEGSNVPMIDKSVLSHTIGQPNTYPGPNTSLSNVTGTDKLEYKSDFVSVGNNGGVDKSIGTEVTNSKTTGFEQSYQAELVVTAGDFKMGESYGYGSSNNQTTSVGSSSTVDGYVPGVSQVAPAECPKFQWALAWYNYIKSNQKFQVVTYIVQ